MAIIDFSIKLFNKNIKIPEYNNLKKPLVSPLYEQEAVLPDLNTFKTMIDTLLEKGYIKYDFDLTTSEGKSYDFTITDATTTNVIHRGQLFATAQTSQNYKINE